jgi:hypothetical protein
LSQGGLIAYPKPAYLEGCRVIAVDASDAVEKGRSGETLSNFEFRRGDLELIRE